MATTISDFFPGVTKRFSITLSLNGVTPDIRADTLTWTIKHRMSDDDTDALLQVTADVATSGVSGIAIFEATPTQTAIETGRHYTDIQWVRSDGSEYIVYSAQVSVLERVSDV